jgi:hypothetical protein
LCLTSNTLRRGEELVLRADPQDQNNGVLMIDPDDYAVKHVNEGERDDIVAKCMKSGARERDLCLSLQKQCLDEGEDSDEENCVDLNDDEEDGEGGDEDM